ILTAVRRGGDRSLPERRRLYVPPGADPHAGRHRPDHGTPLRRTGDPQIEARPSLARPTGADGTGGYRRRDGGGPPMSDTRFMSSFMLLALVSGLTVGLGKVVTTLYAIELGATPFQIGIVSAMESAGMILVTVPAGFIIARYGARPIYFASSFGPLLINLALPFAGGWAGLALGRW